MFIKEKLYRFKYRILFKIAFIFRKSYIIKDNKRCYGKTYLIKTLSNKYNYEILQGGSNKVDEQFKQYIHKHNKIILLDIYFKNRTELNLIERTISNLASYNHILIGFVTYCGNKKWID